MYKVLSAFVIGSAIVFTTSQAASCGNAETPPADTTQNLSSTDTGSAPVETKAANTNYKPAFAGQTRVTGVITKTPYEGKVLSSDLKNPWGIAVLPDGRFLITEKRGNMRIAGTDGKLTEPITGIPAVNARGQGGLLGLTLDPAFAQNRIVYRVLIIKKRKSIF